MPHRTPQTRCLAPGRRRARRRPSQTIRPEHFRPAFELAMADHLAEIEAIAAAPQAPSFDNTIAALERSGRALDRVNAVF